MKVKFENHKASLFVEDDLNTHVCVDSSDWYGYEAYLFFRKADLEGGLQWATQFASSCLVVRENSVIPLASIRRI